MSFIFVKDVQHYTVIDFMRSTNDLHLKTMSGIHYWLMEAVGWGLPAPNKVFMVTSRPKSKVYFYFIKLIGIFLHKIETFKITKMDFYSL